MLPVPPGHAQARSVLALTMLVAARIAQPRVAEFTSPAGIASAGIADAASVLATVEIAQLLRAVLAAPLGLARARLAVQIEGAVAGAVGQALERVLVHGGTVRALPALFADAGAVGAEAVAGAGRVGTVHWKRGRGAAISTRVAGPGCITLFVTLRC